MQTPVERASWLAAIQEVLTTIEPARAVVELLDVVRHEQRWGEAKRVFGSLRDSSFLPSTATPTGVVYVSELCAKVLYNLSMERMPFDSDSGWFIAPAIHSLIKVVPSARPELERALFEF